MKKDLMNFTDTNHQINMTSEHLILKVSIYF